MEKPKKMKMPSSENWADLCPDADYPSGYNQGHDDFETYHNAILAEKDKKIGELEAEVKVLRANVYGKDWKEGMSVPACSNDCTYLMGYKEAYNRLKASRLTVLEIENIIEHTSSFAPINVLAQSIHKAQSGKESGK